MQFELFIGYFGNGATVCNKAVEENGNYKTIAHIAECGKITWSVKPSSIPGDALLRIEHCADAHYENWKKWLDSMPEVQEYQKLLDAVPENIMLHVMSLNNQIYEKICYLKQICYENSYF